MPRRWFRLDTAALIFPATMRYDWSNVFRLSAEFREEVDPALLQQAVRDLAPRFPSFYVRLRKGLFWCYLEETDPPCVKEDYAYPLTHMDTDEVREGCLRIFCYRRRIAAEFFHAVTDGHGAGVYFRTLIARYLFLKEGAVCEPGGSVLDLAEAPKPEELEDSFLRHSAAYPASRSEETAYRLRGTKERDGFRHLITGTVDSALLLEKAHECGASVTIFLAAVLAQSIIGLQADSCAGRRQKPVKITLPVDLRRLYPSKTLRNFVLVLNPGVDPSLGSYTLKEICGILTHRMAAEATPQGMSARIAANVLPQKNALLRIAPLFIKSLVMDLVYRASGEKKGCICLSNLGECSLPESLAAHVTRMDLVIGVQRSYPNNCAVISCGGKTRINMIRNIEESELERRFFSALVELGIPVDIESNGR